MRVLNLRAPGSGVGSEEGASGAGVSAGFSAGVSDSGLSTAGAGCAAGAAAGAEGVSSGLEGWALGAATGVDGSAAAADATPESSFWRVRIISSISLTERASIILKRVRERTNSPSLPRKSSSLASARIRKNRSRIRGLKRGSLAKRSSFRCSVSSSTIISVS